MKEKILAIGLLAFLVMSSGCIEEGKEILPDWLMAIFVPGEIDQNGGAYSSSENIYCYPPQEGTQYYREDIQGMPGCVVFRACTGNCYGPVSYGKDYRVGLGELVTCGEETFDVQYAWEYIGRCGDGICCSNLPYYAETRQSCPEDCGYPTTTTTTTAPTTTTIPVTTTTIPPTPPPEDFWDDPVGNTVDFIIDFFVEFPWLQR